jgi:hypothetical protein
MMRSRDSAPLALARPGRARAWVGACSALTLIVIICLSGGAGAAPGDILWTDQWDLAGKDDMARALAVSGNQVFVAGTVNNASGPNEFPNCDWLVQAYDASTGAVLWTNQWDLAGLDDAPLSLAVSGNRVFVAGYGSKPPGNRVWLVRAYDAGTGAVLWTDQWDLAFMAKSLAVSGNQVFVAGEAYTVPWHGDGMVRAYDAGTGAVLWTDQWDLAGEDNSANALAVSGNRVFVAGYGTSASGNGDWMVRAYDASSGAVLWTDQWDLAGKNDMANALAVSGNRVFVTGFGTNASGNIGWLVRAYDASSGAVLWTDQWDLAGGHSYALALDVSGNRVFVAGFDTNASGNWNWLVRGYDAGTGAVLWTDQRDLAGKDDSVNALAVSGNQVFVTGDGTNLSGNRDWLVRAYDASTGAVLWTDQWDLAGKGDNASSLAVSGNRVFVAGYGTNASGFGNWLVRAYEINWEQIGIDQIMTGKLNKRGTKFTPASTFNRGNKVVVRAHLQDKQTLQPVSSAVVSISISGPGYTGVLTGTTDSAGQTEVQWPTTKKTTKGTYTATVTNVVPPDPAESWDGVQKSTPFSLN